MPRQLTAAQLREYILGRDRDSPPPGQLDEVLARHEQWTPALIAQQKELPPEDRLGALVSMATDEERAGLACRWADWALQREREKGHEPDERSWVAVEVARRFARGQASGGEVAAAHSAAESAWAWADTDADVAACGPEHAEGWTESEADARTADYSASAKAAIKAAVRAAAEGVDKGVARALSVAAAKACLAAAQAALSAAEAALRPAESTVCRAAGFAAEAAGWSSTGAGHEYATRQAGEAAEFERQVADAVALLEP